MDEVSNLDDETPGNDKNNDDREQTWRRTKKSDYWGIRFPTNSWIYITSKNSKMENRLTVSTNRLWAWHLGWVESHCINISPEKCVQFNKTHSIKIYLKQKGMLNGFLLYPRQNMIKGMYRQVRYIRYYLLVFVYSLNCSLWWAQNDTRK